MEELEGSVKQVKEARESQGEHKPGNKSTIGYCRGAVGGSVKWPPRSRLELPLFWSLIWSFYLGFAFSHWTLFECRSNHKISDLEEILGEYGGR